MSSESLYIDPNFFKEISVNPLTATGSRLMFLLFYNLCQVDRCDFLEYDVKLLAKSLRLAPQVIKKELNNLVKRGFIEVYKLNGYRYLRFNKYLREGFENGR